MSYSHRLIILSCLLFSANAQAYEFFLDALYWQASETIDWVLTNNFNTANQELSYQTSSFDYKPGFRVGVGYHGAWDTEFYYTNFYSKTSDTANGNLTSTFLGGRLIQSTHTPAFFYHSGQATFSINYNMLDWDFSQRFNVSRALMLRPVIGIRGGSIYQDVTSSFQGTISITESVKNNFSGVGPKAGIASLWKVWCINESQVSIFANFTTSYMWGNWQISDKTVESNGSIFVIETGNRNFGALAVQGILGLDVSYRCFAVKLGYEIADWFDQYQVFDDGTGAHNNDLILQGLTLRVTYDFL